MITDWARMEQTEERLKVKTIHDIKHGSVRETIGSHTCNGPSRNMYDQK